MTLIQKIANYFLLVFATSFVAKSSYAQLQFIQNKGQWNKAVVYKSDIPTGAFFLEKDGFTVVLHNAEDLENFEAKKHGSMPTTTNDSINVKTRLSDNTTKQNTITSSQSNIIHSHAYKVNFVGASDDVQIIAEKPLDSYNNYYIGGDKSKWQSNCKIYQGITYKNIYPNIDVHYYTNAGTLKYDIIIRPGGNVNDIVMRYDGVNKMQVKNRELVVTTSVGETKQLYPYTYQLQGDTRQTLDCKYDLKDSTVKFKIKDQIEGSTIVIDPTWIFSTFTGSKADNWGYTATPGPDGSFYAGGTVFSTGYPVSPGAYESNYSGGYLVSDDPGYDIGIMKFSPDGTQRIYATYLGGTGNEQPHSMICDPQGNLIVAGRTNSPNNSFPTTIPQIGPGGGYDIFVVKFNATGTALLGAVKMGGSGDDGVNIADKEELIVQNKGATEINRNYGDDARSEVILDNNNNIYLASCTQSKDFPVSNSPIQPVFGGGYQDGAIIEFAPDLSSVIFSTFFGGTGEDACFVLSISPTTGNLYVAGGTTSTSLPGNMTGVISNSFSGGNADGFVTSLKADGSALIKTTYEGTSGDDLVYGLKFDNDGFPYITGATTGNWPIINATFSNAGAKQFISKLMPDLSAYIYSTVFGSRSSLPNISPVAFLVDRCQNVYVSGWGGTFDSGSGYPNAGTNGMPVTAGAIKATTDNNDFYFFVLKEGAASQLYGSFFGENGGFDDHVDGGTSRFDANGIIYQAICANCNYETSSGTIAKGTFPTTAGVWSTVNPAGGFGCNEAAVKIAMNFAGIKAALKTVGDNILYDTSGCSPFTVTFSDTLQIAKKYIWIYGDGTSNDTTTSGTIQHTYTLATGVTKGSFIATLIVEDSTTCNIRDTVYQGIRVGSNAAALNFTYSKIGSCNQYSYQFINTSTDFSGSFEPHTFVWQYGDGTIDTLSLNDVNIHQYPSPGTYDVTLCSIDTLVCNTLNCKDSFINISSIVTANFTSPATGCNPYIASFQNNSIGASTYLWNFGDPSSGALNGSTNFNPTHIYNDTGNYTIQLIAFNPNSCNKRDTFSITINVAGKPTANFTWSPNPPTQNTPTQFENSSTGATKYIWNFNEKGNTSTDVNPSYQFNSTGTFNVCLQAINNNGCIDTTCQQVSAIVNPLLDIPKAFMPTKPGINSVIKVVGFGIANMDWKIYNRWGELIFESKSPSDGWDGTFKGTIQPMDVYTYTLEANFTNNKTVRKTGDITLIR